MYPFLMYNGSMTHTTTKVDLFQRGQLLLPSFPHSQCFAGLLTACPSLSSVQYQTSSPDRSRYFKATFCAFALYYRSRLQWLQAQPCRDATQLIIAMSQIVISSKIIALRIHYVTVQLAIGHQQWPQLLLQVFLRLNYDAQKPFFLNESTH